MSEWINREIQFPDIDRILCTGSNQVFICEMMKTKFGNFYCSTNSGHVEFQDMPEWTHWMPLPNPPEEI